MRSMRAPRSATPEPLDPESVSPSGPRRAAKQAALVLLCLLWIVVGLIGHDPWKNDDATTFGVAFDMARTGDVVVPRLAGEPWLETGPLVPAIAAATMRAFSPPLVPHNAARLAAGLLLVAILACSSLACRELNGRAFRWIPVLILIGSIGFWERAHVLSAELGLTTGVAVGVYGLALALRRPLPGGIALGAGIAVGFLSRGYAVPLWMLATVAILPLVSATWRTKAHLATVGIAVAVALSLSAAWPIALAQRSPDIHAAWTVAENWREYFAPAAGGGFDPLYVVKNLPWFAWPALPLALWTLWIRGRGFNGGMADPGVVLPGVLALVVFVSLSFERDPKLIGVMPLLVPLALVGALEVDSLKRGLSGALDWFGILTFGLAAMLVWGIWIDSYLNGMSLSAARMFRDSEIGFRPTFKLWAMLAALGMTLLWIAMVRPARRSNRRAVLNWAIGMVLLWTLVSTIWLPYLDSRRSYRVVAEALRTQVPDGACVASRNLGGAQRALFAYLAGLETMREEAGRGADCPLLLVQLGRNDVDVPGPAGWTPVWEGSRRGDESEKFVLYRRSAS